LQSTPNASAARRILRAENHATPAMPEASGL